MSYDANDRLTPLENVVRAKLEKNDVYFKAKQDVELSDYYINFKEGALLYKTNLKALLNKEAYFSVMYDASDVISDEGLVRMPINVLVVLIASKKIVAINNRTDKLDKDIAELVLYEQKNSQVSSGGH